MITKLTKTIFCGLLIFIPLILSFQYDFCAGYTIIQYGMAVLMARIILGYCALIYVMHIGFELSSVINMRYRIVKDPAFTSIYEAHYFTFNMCCIPMWKPVSTKLTSYEHQNVFGAKYEDYHESENYFTSENDAVNAIEEHKEELRKNRKEWTSPSTKTKPTVKYM